MDGRIDYSNYTEGELLEALGTIDRDRYPVNFERLQTVLKVRRETKPLSASEADTAASLAAIESFPVRLSPGRGPLAWLEPARNGFRLVGAGTVSIGANVVSISGRRFGLVLGLPLLRHIELERTSILNVERLQNAVRLEYRGLDAKPKSLTLWARDSGSAERIAEELPGARTDDFEPQLQKEIEFEQQLQARSTHAPITMMLVAGNVLVFLWGLTFGDAAILRPSSGALLAAGSNYGPYTTAGDWWRLITGTFVHIGIVHLILNMWALASVAPLAERLFGGGRYLLLYFVGAICASLSSIIWQPAVHSAGASGAIFSVFGALLAALASGHRAVPRSLTSALGYSLFVFAAYALCVGFLVDGVDNAAHVGGLLCGAVLGWIYSRRAHAKLIVRTSRMVMMITVAVSACIGIAAALAMYRSESLSGESRYQQVRHWLVTKEAEAVERQTRIWNLARDNRLSDEAFANSMEASVLPIWKEAESRLNAIALPADSSFYSDLQFLRALAATRRNAYELCIHGARIHSEEVVQQCTLELRRGDDLVESHKRSKQLIPVGS